MRSRILGVSSACCTCVALVLLLALVVGGVALWVKYREKARQAIHFISTNDIDFEKLDKVGKVVAAIEKSDLPKAVNKLMEDMKEIEKIQ